MENKKNTYTEDSIRSLDWKEHIRTRPGMYIGKLGDGSAKDDGIYVLIKEVIDNSIDEHLMGHGRQIKIKVKLIIFWGFCTIFRSGLTSVFDSCSI